jgi:hypothetical protein
MAKAKTTINVGEIQAKALIFSDGQNGRWVVCAERMAYLDFQKKYASDYKDGLNWKPADGANMDSDAPTWFAVASDDCMDPPVVIVRSDSAGEAIDIAVDEFNHLRILPPDLDDYLSDEQPASKGKAGMHDEEPWYTDNVNWTNNGQPYDGDLIKVWEVKLITIEV